MATKKQKGVKIARDGASARFTVSWDHGQKKYTDQEMIWYEVYSKTTDKNKKKRHSKAHKVNLTAKAKKKAIKIDWGDYPPTGTKRLCSIKVKLRAKAKGKWSGWTKLHAFDVKKPKAPTFNDDQKPAPLSAANTAKYTWNVYDNGKEEMYHWSHYQVVELKNFSGTKLDDVTWSSSYRVKNEYLPYSSLHDYNTVDVPVTVLPVGTETLSQFFRVRTYGPQGFSKWAYSWHVFGLGSKATDVTAQLINTADGYIVSVIWKLGNAKYRKPSDETVVRYSTTPPAVEKTDSGGKVKYKLSCPNNPSPQWTERSVVRDTKGYDKLTFTLDSKLSDDNMLFVQVNNKHDTDDTTNYGNIIPVKTGDLYGTLAAPVLSSAAYVPDTHLVSIAIDRVSTVPDHYTVVYVLNASNEPIVIGIIPFGHSSATVAVPEDIVSGSPKFGVQNMLADYTYDDSGTVTTYSIGKVYMSSSIDWSGGDVADPPKVALSNPDPGVILVEWDWPWATAQSAELSWSTDKYAWESTTAPSTYVISNNHAARWRITGLDYARYYVRVRLIKSADDYETYGLYSDSDTYIDLTAEVPPTPSLTVSPGVVAPDGVVGCYWQYTAEDGSNQLQADIYQAFLDNEGNATYSEVPLTSTNTSQHIDLDIAKLGWTAEGSPYYLALQTMSSFGTRSEKSEIVSVQVVEKLDVSVEFGDGFSTTTEEEITYNWLNRFPFTVNVVGSDYNGATSFYIRRATPYLIERPDGDTAQGFIGETVFIASNVENDHTITIEANDQRLIGSLDDGVKYDMVIVARDQYGQTSEATLPFTVDWDRKAEIPSADILMDYYNSVAILSPIGGPRMDFFMSGGNVYVEAEDVDPDAIGEMAFSFDDADLIYTYENAHADFELVDGDLIVRTGASPTSTGDVCDIYRLTADQPELVYEGAEFGETYVDPYPTLGQNGGYRFVYRTVYNDFKTEEGVPAWADYGWEDGATLNIFDNIIDFDGYQVHLPFNLDISHSWDKDFIETKYLGGAIQGDWNPAISHTVSISTEVAAEYDSETARLMRLLADYAGVCHVRTPDGSSFSANVNVTEDRGDKKLRMLAKFSLDITRVDQEDADGMTYAEWIGE